MTHPSHAQAYEVFRDDFGESTIDTTKWRVYDNINPNERTFFGYTPAPRSEGTTYYYRFFLHKWNPDHPGYFKGTEIYSFPFQLLKSNVVGGYGEVEARVRVTAIPSGAVGGFYTYTTIGTTSNQDELDYEFLGKLGVQSVWTNTWEDGQQSPWTYTNASLNWAANWNIYKIRWVTDSNNSAHVEWYLNGVLVRTAQPPEHIPNESMQIHLNLWAPDSSWLQAYDSSLQPAQSAAGDFTWYSDVDYVVARHTSDPPPPPQSPNAASNATAADSTPAALSTASASALANCVQLSFMDALDSNTATDPGRYVIIVNGQAVPVQSLAYDDPTNTVTLTLPGGSIKAGDQVNISWNDLRDLAGNPVSGQTTIAATL